MKVRKYFVLILLCTSLLLLVLASFQDYAIELAIYQPSSVFGKITSAFGPLPLYWAFYIVCLIQLQKISLVRLRHPLYWLAGIVLSTAAALIYFTLQAVSIFPDWKIWIVSFLLQILPSTWFFVQIKSASPRMLERFQYFLLLLSAGQLILVYLLQGLWIRPNFYVTYSYGQIPYVSWYQLHSAVKGTFMQAFSLEEGFFASFPNACTASAACVLFLSALPRMKPAWKPFSILIYLVITICICLTAFGQMILGAYLSDCAAGFLICLGFYEFSWHKFLSGK